MLNKVNVASEAMDIVVKMTVHTSMSVGIYQNGLYFVGNDVVCKVHPL